MEHDPLSPAAPEPKGSKEKRTKRKKRGFVAPLPVETAVKPEAVEQPKRSALDEALANLAIKKREDAEPKAAKPEKGKKKKPEQEVPEPESEQVETSEAEEAIEADGIDESESDITAENDSDEPLEESEPLLVHELKPNEFSGGEVIIELQGDKPVLERVMPLPETDSHASVEQNATVPAMEYHAETPGTDSLNSEVPIIAPEQVLAHTEQPTEPTQLVAEVLPRPEHIDSPFVTPAVAAGERPATKQDVEDALQIAEKAGQDRGVLAGMLVGGGYEHLKHKHREKRLVGHLEEQGKRLEQATESHHFQTAEQIRLEQRHEQYVQDVEKRFDNALAEKQPAKAAAAETLVVPERLDVPADHRLETSAWHTIEVDSKTGRPVEKPAFEYGHEYYRERAPEATPALERNAAAGDVALTAAALAQSPGGGTLPPPAAATHIPSATTQGTPARQPSEAISDSSPIQTGRLWPWVAALIIIICLIAIIR